MACSSEVKEESMSICRICTLSLNYELHPTGLRTVSAVWKVHDAPCESGFQECPETKMLFSERGELDAYNQYI